MDLSETAHFVKLYLHFPECFRVVCFAALHCACIVKLPHGLPAHTPGYIYHPHCHTTKTWLRI